MSNSNSPTVDDYTSLTDLQAAHVTLVKAGRDVLDPAVAPRITDFIRGAVQAGKALENPDERLAAQGLINFWTARLSAASRAAGRPYTGSPTMGWPMKARWTRIWWVRPVSSRARSRVRWP